MRDKSVRTTFLVTITLGLTFVFAGQVFAGHCYEGFRDCIAECNAAAPGSGGGASLECLTSCNEANSAISARGEECVEQEALQGQEQPEEQTEEPQQGQPRSSSQEQKDLTSESPAPKPSMAVRRLVAGLDISGGETTTAKQGEILLIDFRGGDFVEVNSGASFTYGDKKDETIFEILKGSLRFIFEPSAKLRKVTTCCLVTSVRGTDFVVNEEEDKTEVLVFSGKLAVSDVNGANTVEVDGGYKTEVKKGGKPLKPVLFDPSKINRWFDGVTAENSQRQIGARTWTIAAAIILGGLVFLFFSIRRFLKRAKKRNL